jgi:hypothetical protein
MNLDQLNLLKQNEFFNFEPKFKSSFGKFWKISSKFRYFGMISIVLLFFYFYSPKKKPKEEEEEKKSFINQYIEGENKTNSIFYK